MTLPGLGLPDGNMGIFAFLVIGVWVAIWKGLAMWHSARNDQRNWYIALLILNTLGLLPIIYLIWFKPDSKKGKKKKITS